MNHKKTLTLLAVGTVAIVTIVGGFALLLGRIYSPLLRRMEPAWTFVKPLILIIPFLTGFLSMRPAWSPIDYHVVMLLHVLSASLVFVMGGAVAVTFIGSIMPPCLTPLCSS